MPRKKTADQSAARRRDAVENTYHHGDLRNVLLETAARILASEGAAAVSIREIARRAGVSHAAPYRHYANRETLLADLASGGFDRLRRCFDALPKRAGPTQRLVAMMLTYVAFAQEEPETYRLMFGETIEKSEFPDLMRISGHAFDTLRGAVQALGVAAPATAETLTAWGMAHGLARLIVDHRIDAHVGERIDTERLVRSAADVFVAGVRAVQSG